MSISHSSNYFANLKSDALLQALQEKTNLYYDQLSASGTLGLWRRCHSQYYAGFYNAGRIQSLSDKGDLKKLVVNDFRSLLEYLHILVTKEPPVLKAKASSNEGNPSEVFPVDALLEYYQKYAGMNRAISTAKIYDLLYGSAYVLVEWNDLIGEPYASYADQIVRRGDVQYHPLKPIDVAFDLAHKHADPHSSMPPWVVVRTFVNKYDLAEQFPSHAKSIAEASPPSNYQILTNSLEQFSHLHRSDLIPLYQFFHRKTPSVPLGRHVVFTEDQILKQQALPTPDIPIVKTASYSIDDSGLGYSIAFDMLSVQNAKDKLISTILSNQAVFGLQMILNPRGSNIQYKNLNGLSIIDYDKDPEGNHPKPLDLLKTSPEIFEFVGMLTQYLEKLSGVNNVLRGDTSKNFSGKALALISTLAVQYASNYEKSTADAYRQLGKVTLGVLKQNLSLKKTYQIPSEDGQFLQQTIGSGNLSSDYHIHVELASPLTRTMQGRLGVAEFLLEHGKRIRPEQILHLLTTGRFSKSFYQTLSEDHVIAQENQALISGQQGVRALKLDNHPKHIKAHREALNTNSVRTNPKALERIYQHLKDHLEAWNELTIKEPSLLRVYGIPSYSPSTEQASRPEAQSP